MRTIRAARPYGPQSENDQPVPAELTARLYGAGERDVGELVAGFSATQRADLALSCYHKAHLHRIGLAIAATCERSVLELTLGRALGRALFEQSRDLTVAPGSSANRYPPTVTLATLGAMKAVPDGNAWIDDSEPPPTVAH